MVRPDGVVKIVDFGLARISEADQEWTVQATQAASIIGTRDTCRRSRRAVKSWIHAPISSVWAPCSSKMVTGRPAFPGATPPEVFASLLGQEPAFPCEGMPDGLDTIMARALERDFDARYQTMQEFEVDLRDFRHSKPLVSQLSGN
jgi:serine/threonine protein kinase